MDSLKADIDQAFLLVLSQLLSLGLKLFSGSRI